MYLWQQLQSAALDLINVIGITVSPVCYFGIVLIKRIFKIDYALDAFGRHGIGGIWG
ncbi:hypothetical protein AGMMS49573_03420 [Endomicrobiia bacterium]|uniref:ammonium transporter n=1 Tax=Endomicrobium trichonymphae TaxID=1408204 RepID=UPI0018D4DF39|nr:hypothetical protein AGMMS49523_05980 [Endomicrobiia bacterium]GHT08564.1 hypothetical protein AGMMS49532_03950 [Endomicrobiia bacterium]GHT11673.1 hypothetical protein AGMMS49571_02360 [Endomicrobiia bacterium]GHT15825.1 hypothetical protein AGMMS49573_03420 [Endomicrobiia bacterium]GHT25009.1 hypothetical protein AGMMS49953_08840 [Endomicrobiia bacterium]